MLYNRRVFMSLRISKNPSIEPYLLLYNMCTYNFCFLALISAVRGNHKIKAFLQDVSSCFLL